MNASKAVSVTLDRESWQKIQAVVLEMAVLTDMEGDPDTAAHVLELLVPALTCQWRPCLEQNPLRHTYESN